MDEVVVHIHSGILLNYKKECISVGSNEVDEPLLSAKPPVVSNSVRPHRRQPTRLPHPWDSPGKNTGVGCHFLLQCMKEVKVKSFSRVRLLATQWTAAPQAPPSMGFSRREYWSGVPSPSPHSPLPPLNVEAAPAPPPEIAPLPFLWVPVT